MAEHKLRIDVKLGTKQAQQETKKLSDSFSGVKKEIEDTVKSANELNSEVGKKTECNIDVKKAEKKVEQLTKEINKLKEKEEKLKSGKRLSQYAEELNINHEAYVSKMKDAGKGATLEQFHKAMEDIDADNAKTKEAIRNKYASELSELKEIQNAERNLVQQRSALKAKIELTRQAEEEHAKAVKDTAKETDQSSKRQRVAASEAKRTAANQRAVTNEAKKTSRYQSKTSGETSRLGRLTKRIYSSWTGVRKTVVSVAKGAMSKLGSGIKSAAKLAGNIGSRIKQAVKPAENLRKKFLKIGLAMLAARSAFIMFKQVVSEAMSNNKELQDQLQAAKGVMGEALAPAIQLLVNALGKVVTFADRVYQLFTGTSLIAKYNAKQAQKQADATKDAAENAKEYQKQMASFDVANKLSDNTSSSSSASSGSSTDDSAIKFNEVDVDGWLEEILKKIKTRDWEGVGGTIAEKIVSGLNKIDWDSIRNKAQNAGTNFAEFINGLFRYTDKDGNTLCASIGKTIGNSVNVIIDTTYGFVKKLDWTKVGRELSKGLSTFLKTIDWDKELKSAFKAGEGMSKLLVAFFTEKDKDGDTALDNAAKTIGNIINAIKKYLDGVITELSKTDKSGHTGWYRVGQSFMTALVKGILSIDFSKDKKNAEQVASGLYDMLQGAFDTLYMDSGDGTSYGSKLWEHIGKQIVAGILAGIVTAITLPFAGASTNVSETLRTVFDTVYNGLCEAFGIHSPAENMKPIGRYIWEGLLEGIREKLSLDKLRSWWQENVVAKVQNAWKTVVSVTAEIGGKIKDSFKKLKDKWDSIKNKTNTATGKGSIKDSFKKLKDKWDAFKNKSKRATATGKQKKSFKDMKKKFDNVKSKTVEITAKLKDAITGALNSMIDKINGLIAKLRKISIAGYKPFKDIRNIPKLARGGIVNNPGRGVQATIGEAGREAVLPLDKNTGWMDMLAERLAQRVNGSGQMVQTIITLDGETIAKKVVEVNNRKRVRLNGGLV